MNTFTNKTLLITGGTGSFGNAVLNRFLRTDIGEIRIFSRDEKKQDDMRHDFQTRMPEVANKIKFYIGDVRNKSTLKYAMKGVDYVFHAAALKQVPSCEFFPMEAVKTNVIGTDNVLDSAIDAGVECVICLSTDKAAYPINAMGITKAIEEKIAVAKSRLSGDTKICCTRYGNVMCSRGSVIPLWIDQIRKGNPITLTKRRSISCYSPFRTVRMVIFWFRRHRPVPFRRRLRRCVSSLVVTSPRSRSLAFVMVRRCTRRSSPRRSVPRLRTWGISIGYLQIIVTSITISISLREIPSGLRSRSLTRIIPEDLISKRRRPRLLRWNISKTS